MTKNQIVEEIKNLVDANRGGGQAARKPSRGRGIERDDKQEAREGCRSRSRGGRGRKDAKKEDAWEEGKGDDPWYNGNDPWARASQPGVGKGKGESGKAKGGKAQEGKGTKGKKGNEEEKEKKQAEKMWKRKLARQIWEADEITTLEK